MMPRPAPAPVLAAKPLFSVLTGFLVLLATACGGGDPSVNTTVDGGSFTDSGTTNQDGGPIQQDAGIRLDSGTNLDSGSEPDGCVGDDCSEEQAICGDKLVGEGENCDDGNTKPGDGCSGICRTEPHYSCEKPGEPCESTVVCGDSEIGPGEACDDSNTKPEDGCSDTCLVEPGWACATPGEPCVPVSSQECGNGIVEFPETCDDGKTEANDGCSSTCTQETGWTCPTPGQPCIEDEFCGNGKLSAGGEEECDDANTTPGDGCDGICKQEPFYDCEVNETGLSICVSQIQCGDLKVIGDEACDDGKQCEDGTDCTDNEAACTGIGDGSCAPRAGDGCAASCKSTEPGYTCPTTSGVGGTCVPVPEEVCGDGKLSFGEYCDDGNDDPTDGCNTSCQVAPGYTCPTPGEVCTLIRWCGDGSRDTGESCDDGSVCEDGTTDCSGNPDACNGIGTGTCGPAGGDGCSATCVVEAGYDCPSDGGACTELNFCGDGSLGGEETCDLGSECEDGTPCNTDPSVCDGIGSGTCSLVNHTGCNNCTLTPGWSCPGNITCRAAECGDGILVGAEQCDFAASVPGCTDCKIDPGWDCDDETCWEPQCGDGVVDAGEQCEDDNLAPFDGCFECTLDPQCAGGVCDPVCGDGQRFDGEECDDGNKFNGDGCSSTCEAEPGFICTDVNDSVAPELKLPIIYRDFIGGRLENDTEDMENARAAAGVSLHPDFNTYWGAGTEGIVESTLGVDGKPVYTSPNNPGEGDLACCCCEGSSTNPNTSGEVNFNQWFNDDPSVNKTFYSELTLTQQDIDPTAGVEMAYVFDSDQAPYNGIFDPLTGVGFDAEGLEPYANDDDRGGLCDHNMSFTSETHFWFQYEGGERFEFSGDDDVWVFVNGHLVIDLGALHEKKTASFTLGDTAASEGIASWESNIDPAGPRPDVDTEMEFGGVYEFVLFHAERQECGSNFKLTLKNFSRPKSDCSSQCGDGIVASDEICDDGVNDGSYGGCMPGCDELGPYCGDTDLDAGEECDSGGSFVTYGGLTQACGPSCLWAPYCGDGSVDGAWGEACDDGTNDGSYGTCMPDCSLAPFCGDGAATGDEECDDGINNGTPASLCQTDCSWKCGNGELDSGEQCDDGAAENTGGYGKCKADCSLGPMCGDGIKQETEQCDDGKNDGSYGTCAPGCVFGPRCGDNMVQDTAGELCDDGAGNQAGAYGPDLCTTRCLPAPFCGDSAVDVGHGETCDDGANTGEPGSCTPDCKDYVDLATCGNGDLDEGELCDDGPDNGTAASDCDVRCKFKCGNGLVDTGETCDNGINDGSYGSCESDCSFAGYCGDGAKEGPEECDEGEDNQANPYGEGKCTNTCKKAPYCGDGRIQASFDEVCDGQPGCGANCEWIITR